VLLGVLSWGSDDCVGLDAYERLDELRGWLEESVVGFASSTPCGAAGDP